MSEDTAPYPNAYPWSTWDEQRHRMERPYHVIEFVAHDDEEFDAGVNTFEVPRVYKKNPPRKRKLPPVEFKGLRIKLAIIRDADFDPVLEPIIANPTTLYDLMVDTATAEPVECMWVVPVTARHRVIGIHELARGQITQVTVTPVDVLRAVIAVGAPAFFLVHNHPSGEPSFSEDDRVLTKRIATAASVLTVHMLDHIVIGVRGRFAAVSTIEPILLEPASNIVR